MPMRTSDFTYELPQELIAQTPIERRDQSRLLVVDRSTDGVTHRRFHELTDLLQSGDLLVLNDSRVIPARLYGRRRDTGGKVELLLVRRESPGLWQCLARPARSLRPGTQLSFDSGLEARVRDLSEGGLRRIELNDESLITLVGRTPVPPYIHTPLEDPERYQTVYAGHGQWKEGSVAAPTAGLHFTHELMDRLDHMGVELVYVTLHIGLDTFRPVDVEDVETHTLHTEYWELPPETAEAVNRARRDNRRVVAVGTTSVRVLEQAALLAEGRGSDAVYPGSGWADLFILPGHGFRVVDAMVTNFHLPRSTLLMMVSAFAGRERVLAAYEEAVREEYRFYSFGDAMLIV